MASNDREALVALFHATDGNNWKDKTNWCTDADISRWKGVGVDRHGRVVHLQLSWNNLEGRIPLELGNLAALIKLILGGNQLSGSIPEEIGGLQKLQNLRLFGNKLTGPIPAALGALSELGAINLSGNKLTGPIPAELGALSELKALRLDRNNLTGPVPHALGALSGLKVLELGSNELIGPIPPELGNRGAARVFEQSISFGGTSSAVLHMSAWRVEQPAQGQGGESKEPLPHKTSGKDSPKVSGARAGTEHPILDLTVERLKAVTRGICGGRDAALPSNASPPDGPTHGEGRKQGEQRESGKGAAEESPPQLQEVLPVLLTFLDSRSWCACLAVSPAARDAVQALFSGLIPDGPRLDEGWTVPMDFLTLKTDKAGTPHLAANECGITIHGLPGSLAHLKAVVIPAPQSGFITIEGEQYISTSPILRCGWKGSEFSPGPWTVRFPLEEENGLSSPTELSQVLRRGDGLGDEWEVETSELKASQRHPSMQVEITHFSDIMTADRLRTIQKSKRLFYKRKRVWGTKFFSREVHVYNASSEDMTVLQVVPAVMEGGKGVEVSFPMIASASGNKEYAVLDAQSREFCRIAKWTNAQAGSGDEPPTDPAKFQTLPGAGTMRVVPYTVAGSRTTNDLRVFPRHFFHCSAGYDYYLLQRIIGSEPRFWEEAVPNGVSEERAVMKIVNS